MGDRNPKKIQDERIHLVREYNAMFRLGSTMCGIRFAATAIYRAHSVSLAPIDDPKVLRWQVTRTHGYWIAATCLACVGQVRT